MRYLLSLLFLTACMTSCSNQKKQPVANQELQTRQATDTSDIFPVTEFFLGQIMEIKQIGVNPVRISTVAGKTDSTWLKVEELQQAFSAFLEPVIDNEHMAPYFAENRFLDQTLGAYTFTYEPKVALPDSLEVQRWDVYIHPKNRSVKRIYIEKNGPGGELVQLTWESQQWAKAVYLSSAGVMEKEVLIKWKFE